MKLSAIVPLLLCCSCSLIPGTDAHTIKAAEKSVADGTKDPRSTEFRNVSVVAGNTVCGEVNSKNGFGAYVGFTPFAYGSEGAGFIASPDAIDTDHQVALSDAATACFKAKYPAVLRQITEANRLNKQADEMEKQADRIDAMADRIEAGAN